LAVINSPFLTQKTETLQLTAVRSPFSSRNPYTTATITIAPAIVTFVLSKASRMPKNRTAEMHEK